MTCLKALLLGCSSLGLAASLGAAPATRLTAPPSPTNEPKVILRLLKTVVEMPHPGGMLHTPRNDTNIMPTIRPPYLTPRREWIPRTFNGNAFYIIPCALGVTPAR